MPLKAPGPDGFPALFYQAYWLIVGDQVVDFVMNVFSSGRLLREVNFTYIVFILKEGEVSSFSNLRPISLCNLSYKISSKLIANRLRPFLDRFISSSQAAFVSGRWILENLI